MTPAEARSLYANEKARRAERLAQRPELREAQAEFARQLAAQQQAGKGGRPRKDGTPIKSPRPGKPQIVARREDPADVLWRSLPYYGAGE